MTEVSHVGGDDALDDASDHELVERVRAGDAGAYAILWRRHSGPAYGVARTFLALDADDLVSEAFARVLVAIRAGGGPARAFRPYITMTVRNIGRSQHVRESVLVDADFEWRSGELANGEVAAVADFERWVALQAFDSLPVRWQEVLWYSEVDGLKARTISTYLGIPANAVSALLVRAKQGLRDAWISAHLAAARSPECASTISNLGAFTRHRLSYRASSAVVRHLRDCDRCRSAYAEARQVSSLLLTLLPIFAGTAGAVGYAASASTPAVSQALGALLARPDALVDSWGASAAGVPGPVSMVMAVPAALGAVVGIGSPVTVGAASVAVLSVVAAAIIAVSPAITPVQAPSELLAAAITSATDSLPGDSPTPDTLPSLVTDAHAMPVPPMTASPSVEQPTVRDARASPTSDRSEDGPLIFHLPVDSSTTTVDLLYADGVPTGGYTPSVSFTTDGSEGSDGFAGSGTGGDVDLLKLATVPPTDGDDATPLRATLTQPDPRYLPQISGDGAWPGALIVLTDGRDVVVGSGTVDPDGSWRARVSDGLGSGTVRAVQVTVDRVSAPSVAMAYRTEEGPSIRQVAVGDADEPDSLSLVFSGLVGASLQREVVDATLLETLTLSDAGEQGETVSVSPGTHTVRVRYVDPTTGDVGAFAEMTFEVP